MPLQVLVDSDIIVYKIAYSVEVPIYVVNGKIYSTKDQAVKAAEKQEAEVFKRKHVGSEKELRTNLKQLLDQISDDLGSKDLKHFLTSTKKEPNYRHKIATIQGYKTNRDSKKPFYYHKVREILYKEHGATLVHGQESDDELVIQQHASYKKYKNWDLSVIASIDKDLLTTPGQHYNLTSRSIQMITKEQAYKNFYRQLLSGDVTDNIPGLHRLLTLNNLEDRAKQLVKDRYLQAYEQFSIEHNQKQCYDYVYQLYNNHGFGEKEVGEIFNLLWLRRYPGQDGWSDHKRKYRL